METNILTLIGQLFQPLLPPLFRRNSKTTMWCRKKVCLVLQELHCVWLKQVGVVICIINVCINFAAKMLHMLLRLELTV